MRLSRFLGSTLILGVFVACGDSGDGGSGGTGAGNTGATGGTGSSSGGGGSGNVGGDTSTGGMGTSNGGMGGSMGECSTENDCPLGSICEAGACVPGCSATHGCEGGLACCDGACYDLTSDLDHCGDCNTACPIEQNIESVCNGTCGFATQCDPGYADCNGTLSDGCEVQGTCLCTIGDTQPCYTGPAGTENIGACKSGTQTCINGQAWTACVGSVGPSMELCNNGIDEDCNNVVDDVPDLDGDGWTACNGDCCDVAGTCGANPERINPSAFETPGNMVDDDCDPSTPDTVPTGCSTTEKFTGVSAMDVVNAIDLCQTTTANSPKWGVLSADFRRADGSVASGAFLTNMQNYQAAIMTQYGNATNTPRFGATFAGLSSGRMRDSGDAGYISPNGGTNFATASVNPPTVYTSQHGGNLQSSLSCYGNCPAGSGAYDSVAVRVNIKVPSNAQSFSYKFRFFSSEFWRWSCTPYNDFYLALLTSGAAGIPADHNISFDSANNPVSVNNGFFDFCQVRGCQTCPLGSGALTGTGMDAITSDPTYGNGLTGGGTNWLTTTAPVVPGETITIEFNLFDVSDGNLDSNVILDDWEWSVNSSGVGTTG
ncbi:MAG: choice-of-anchor L domain-containing protein [Polyangiaceae bacterium]